MVQHSCVDVRDALVVTHGAVPSKTVAVCSVALSALGGAPK